MTKDEALEEAVFAEVEPLTEALYKIIITQPPSPASHLATIAAAANIAVMATYSAQTITSLRGNGLFHATVRPRHSCSLTCARADPRVTGTTPDNHRP